MIMATPRSRTSSRSLPKKAFAAARDTVAERIGAELEEIFFTSGGTESNNWAVKSALFAQGCRREVITSRIEHHAVLNACKGRFLSLAYR